MLLSILMMSLFVFVSARFDDEYYNFRTPPVLPTTMSTPYTGQQKLFPYNYPSEYFAAQEAAKAAAYQRNQINNNYRLNQQQQLQESSFLQQNRNHQRNPKYEYKQQLPQGQQSRYHVTWLSPNN